MRAPLLVFLLVSAHVLAVCRGRTLDDLEDETDDENWPVLCPPENYYNKQLENCVPCSRCPLNNIITNPCYRFQDTKCGPFLDFEMVQKLHQDSSAESQEDSKEAGLLFPQTEKDDLDDSKQASNIGEDGFNKHEANRQWKIAALKISLIIGGCVVLLLVAIIVCIVCIKRRLVTEKKLVCEYMPPPGAAAHVIDC